MGQEYIRGLEINSLSGYPKNQLLFDDFEKDNARIVTGTGTGFAATRITTNSMTKGAALRVNTRVISAAIGDEVLASLPALSTPEGIVSVLVDFSLPTLLAATQFNFTYGTFWKSYTVIAGFRWTDSTKRWSYLNSGGTWTEISTKEIRFTSDYFDRLTFSFDINTGKYISCNVSGHAYSVSDLQIYKNLAGTTNLSGVDIQIVTENAASNIIVVDKIGAWNGEI